MSVVALQIVEPGLQGHFGIAVMAVVALQLARPALQRHFGIVVMSAVESMSCQRRALDAHDNNLGKTRRFPGDGPMHGRSAAVSDFPQNAKSKKRNFYKGHVAKGRL